MPLPPEVFVSTPERDEVASAYRKLEQLRILNDQSPWTNDPVFGIILKNQPKLSFQEAVKLLGNATAAMVFGEVFPIPDLPRPDSDPRDAAICFKSRSNGDFTFFSSENQTILSSGTRLLMVRHEDKEVYPLTLLSPFCEVLQTT